MPPRSAASSLISADYAALEMMRIASSESAVLAHPKPDLQTTSGAYVGNINRLEEHAERLSMGSDMAEEIRKLHHEQKLSDSRRSSIGMAHRAQDPPAMGRSVSGNGVGRSRGASYSSQGNSIVDINHAARRGGYSPSAFVTSPVGSIHSGSWSQTSVQRLRSTTRLTTVEDTLEPRPCDCSQPLQEDEDEEYAEHNDSPSRASFADEMKAIAHHIHLQLDSEPPPLEQTEEHSMAKMDAQEQDANSFGRPKSPAEIPDRPPTPNSTNTYHQAQNPFADFDGVHWTSSIRGASDSTSVSGVRLDDGAMRASSASISSPLLHGRPETWEQPPPQGDLVFYPAPVPKSLNLPQKLSNRPAAAAVSKRRDQLISISGLGRPDKRAAPWLEEEPGHDKPRSHASKTTLEMAGLPPQLRASLFFDARPVHQEVEVKSGSAVATLDSVLEASASLPANAFTNHPIAGHEGAKVYKRQGANAARRSATSLLSLNPNPEARKSTATLSRTSKVQELGEKMKKRRSSFGLIFGRRSRSTNELEPAASETLNQRDGQAGMMNVRTQFDRGTVDADIYSGEAPAHESDLEAEAGEDVPFRRGAHDDSSDDGEGHHQESHQTLGADPDLDDEPHAQAYDGEGYGEEAWGEGEEEEQFLGAPITLLAELTKRKAQQKRRTRTAATTFSRGMHSTLLEMDAVAEIEHRRRVKARVPLAWEDPYLRTHMEAEHDDEDVPLALLFSGSPGVARKIGGRGRESMKNGGAVVEADWDRPLGLIEQRELEDNEPLSRRRNRLRGIDPVTMTKRNTAFGIRMGQSTLSLPMNDLANMPAHSPDSAGNIHLDTRPEPEQPSQSDDDEPLAHCLQRLMTRDVLNPNTADRASKQLSTNFASGLPSPLGLTTGGEGEEQINDLAAAPWLTPTQGDTPDPDETLGQRRARLQAQAALQGHGQVQSWRTSSTNLVANSNELRRRSTMADLLAAHPLTAQSNAVRKVSHDALTNAMPAGSLLAKHDAIARRHKKMLSDANALQKFGVDAGGGYLGPLMDARGGKEGEFDRGLLAERERMIRMGLRGNGSHVSLPASALDPVEPQMGDASSGMIGRLGMSMDMDMGLEPIVAQRMQQMHQMHQMQLQWQMQMQMMGMLPPPPMMKTDMMGMGSVYGQQLRQQNPLYMSTMAVGSTCTPSLANMPGQQPTYAAYAQQQMGMSAGSVASGGAEVGSRQREAIDRWRQSITTGIPRVG